MKIANSAGFSIVELAVTLVVLGIVLAFSVPAFQNISKTYRLKGATENLAGQLRLSREKAIATGVDQRLHFRGPPDNDYHVHYVTGVQGAEWDLPRGITYASGANTYLTLKPDGRSATSGTIVLTDTRGLRDTVRIQLSGLVLVK